MILQYKPWRWATLPKGDFENYLQNGDMKVVRYNTGPTIQYDHITLVLDGA
jgi:hypothetical protein